jgi:hypothetical protein
MIAVTKLPVYYWLIRLDNYVRLILIKRIEITFGTFFYNTLLPSCQLQKRVQYQPQLF